MAQDAEKYTAWIAMLLTWNLVLTGIMIFYLAFFSAQQLSTEDIAQTCMQSDKQN